MRRDSPDIFVCMWLIMEKKLFDTFLKHQVVGKPVRDGWFRRNATILWKESYPHLPSLFFVFSRRWFRGFLSRHRIVLRFVTNSVQSLPVVYKEQILIWLQFNRHNRILTPLVRLPTIARAPLSPLSLLICNDNQGGIPDHWICNVNKTPILWEYLLGQTYNLQGAKIIWSKSAESGSEKRQCTLFLWIFGDGIPRVPSILNFTATTGDKIRKKKAHWWDKRVHIEFTPTGWINETVFIKFIKQFLVPIFGHQRALFVYDRYRAHLTAPVIQTCWENTIIPSLILAGTTGLTQPLDIAVNEPFKGLLREFPEEARDQVKKAGNFEKRSMDQHRIVTTEAVARAWESWHSDLDKQRTGIQAFRNTGITRPVDGSCGHELKIKGFVPGELTIGDWIRTEEEVDGYGTSEKENSELPLSGASDCIEFQLQDE